MIIRLLTESDRQAVLDYLYQEPHFNIFPIVDIETFGFHNDFQRVYGEFDDDGNYVSVFLRYRKNAIYYAHEPRFNEDYLSLFKTDPFEYISCKTHLMDLIHPHLDHFERRGMYFCKAEGPFSFAEDEVNIEIGVVRTKADCEKLYDLLTTIDEFGYHYQDKATYVENRLKSLAMGLSLYIEEDGRIVSSVSTTAETTKNAMVVGVATLKEYRNRGYAAVLMKTLMRFYTEEKQKGLCLFYDNPDAGKIYLRLGFVPMGTWDMCQKQTLKD